MSGAAYGIASFVDGFFKGRDIRHGWEDRKDEKARQKRADEIMEAREARAAAEFDWTMGERRRTREEEDFFRRTQEEAIDATRRAMEGNPQTPGAVPAGASPSVTVSTSGNGVPAIVPQAYGPGQGALDRATDRIFTAPPAAAPAVPRVVTDPRVDMPAGAMPAGPAPGMDPRLSMPPGAMPPAGMTLEQAMAAVGPDAMGYGPGRVDPRLAAAAGMPGAPPLPSREAVPPVTFAEWQEMSRSERKRRGLPTSVLGGQIYFSELFGGKTPAAAPGTVDPVFSALPQADYNHNWFEPGGMAADAGEALTRTGRAVGNVAREVVPKGLDMLTGKPVLDFVRPGVNAVGEYMTGNPEVMGPVPGFQGMADQMLGATPPAAPATEATFNARSTPVQPPFNPPSSPVQPPAAPVNQAAAAPEGAGPRIANLPKDMTATERQLAETGMQEMAASTTPALQAAAAVAGGPMGAAPEPGKDGKPKPITEAQRNRGAKDFMDHYMEVGAPMVVEALLSRGRLEDATKFMDWMEQRSTKAAMDNWAKAAFAISVGDFDSFAENAIEAYNRLDYFPDGTTIVKEESGFTKDRDGNINGARITYRDEATGNTFEQVFSGPDDLVRFGITMLAPENAFEMFLQQQQAAAESALGAAKDAQKEERETRELILEQANKLVENSKGLDGRPTITFEDAQAIIRQQLGLDPAPGEEPVAPTGNTEGDVPLVFRP